MQYWMLLVVAAIAAIAVNHEIGGAQGVEIGVRSLPTYDSEAMKVFKKSLSTADQRLLKRHFSKTRFIQALLDKKGVDKRSEIPSQTGQSCCSCSAGSEGCYHPSDLKRSNVIRCCDSASSTAEKRSKELTAEEVIALQSPADKEILQKHPSKVHYLVDEVNHPQELESNKRSKAEDSDIAKRFMQDVDAAKRHGIKLQDLLATIKRRTLTTKN